MSEEPYIQFQVPGWPYSVVRLPIDPEVEDDLTANSIERAVWWAEVLGNALTARYSTTAADAPPPHGDDIPAADHPNAPRPQQQRAQPNPMPTSSTYGGAKFFCPTHNEELRPSIKNKTMEWDDTVQMEVPASWFHTADNKTCSVWRSKALIRIPVAG